MGLSRKWDAKEAGREVTKDALDRLGAKPDFFLLFSTVHYKDNGGFEKFLEGVWEVLPKGTPLIGGTVPGFISQDGCFTRGATALAVSYPNMDVAMGYGMQTKRNPEKAAKKFIGMIEEDFENSLYRNRFVFDFVSGSVVLKIPGYGYRKVIDSEFLSKSITKFFSVSQILMQKGLGREDEIFEEIAKKLPDYGMILGSSTDNFKGMYNCQFFGNRVLENSVVGLGIATDLDFDVFTNHGMKKSNVKLKITKLSKDGHIIQEINGRPAVPELSRLLNWPRGFLNDETLLLKIFYYPLSMKRHDREVPAVMALVLKDYIVTPCKVDKGDAWIMNMSGKSLIDSMETNMASFKGMKPEFGLFSVCITILQTLGNNVAEIRKTIRKYMRDKPFLLFFSTGEGTYSPERGFTYANMSYNTAIMGHKKS